MIVCLNRALSGKGPFSLLWPYCYITVLTYIYKYSVIILNFLVNYFSSTSLLSNYFYKTLQRLFWHNICKLGHLILKKTKSWHQFTYRDLSFVQVTKGAKHLLLFCLFLETCL